MPEDRLYVLAEDGRTPVPFKGPLSEWHFQVFGPEKTLRRDDFPCGGFVSTIFMGVAIGPWEPPRLFETMAFKPDGEAAFQHRETTYDRAMKTHANVLKHVMEKAAGG